jgi:hypothetical protein
MANNSRIMFNPVTKEIEVEGTEQFVKTYFDKLQAMIFGATEKKTTIKKEPKTLKAVPAKKSKKGTKKASGKKKITNQASVIELIQGSTEGISTAELIKKTGLAERQIWSIAYRAAKDGKIKKLKRGAYGAA